MSLITPAQVWANDAVGRWAGEKLEMDISDKLDTAAQYLIRFAPEEGVPVSILEAEVLLDGIAQPSLLRLEEGRTDALVLTLPAVGQKVRLRARVQGARSGTVLLQKL